MHIYEHKQMRRWTYIRHSYDTLHIRWQ